MCISYNINTGEDVKYGENQLQDPPSQVKQLFGSFVSFGNGQVYTFERSLFGSGGFIVPFDYNLYCHSKLVPIEK